MTARNGRIEKDARSGVVAGYDRRRGAADTAEDPPFQAARCPKECPGGAYLIVVVLIPRSPLGRGTYMKWAEP